MSPEAKERLRPALDAGNVAQTMAAPATAIVAYDLEFYERLPLLVPHRDARSGSGQAGRIRYGVAERDIAGPYLIIAARALGLDCGPMGGFDSARVDATFFPEGTVKSNFLCNLGYGDPAKLHPRAPRLGLTTPAASFREEGSPPDRPDPVVSACRDRNRSCAKGR